MAGAASGEGAFGRSTTGTEVAETFKDRIRGRTVLITGTSPNSIGEATALAVARGAPALLILASRTQAKLRAVARRIHDEVLGSAGESIVTTVRTVVVDLASQRSVREAAARVRTLTSRLDVLINNAGVSLSTKQWSPDGVELTFATNHLGPFLLTRLLLPLLEEGARNGKPGATRVINVSSSAYLISPMRFSDYNFEGKPLASDEQPRKNLPAHLYAEIDGFPGTIAYGVSKTANILFCVALNDRLGSRGIRSLAVYPGDILTGLVREASPEMLRAVEIAPAGTFKSPDQGCATSLVAAFDPSLSDTLYLADCQEARVARYASDKWKAEKLWGLSEELTTLTGGIKL
ncbi:hypothetical protein F4778DRAFT_152637 [Xylariomycetidae sp. FL2044]|nr:hypothetical protein F4778DRAFT_152637 [Xylariomycetidae sp. FL2044]